MARLSNFSILWRRRGETCVHFQEHELIRPDHAATGKYRTSNSRTAAAPSSRVSMFCLNSSDRLPSTVLLARARLAERLRGVSLVRSRQETGVPSVSWDEFEADDDLTIVDSGIWEPENLIERFESAIQLIDIGGQANRDFPFQNPRNKPSGLTLEEICSLDCKTFKEAECDETVELFECSICLDKFHEGDALLRLYCGHRFHYICLEPWLQSCGDCRIVETVKTSVSLAERH
ncbi:hypothetical protein J5N97_015733 [Dioscorea zingiberensis]|uniref:RING-type domain-containing protein n=1 Tax=Dioscorea zingiberensis TaxID=325984 RepID=A0A9D5CI37_9LILI|nr:hypothetical protein J5N97_015733 [Dioscorea zingiberensis]